MRPGDTHRGIAVRGIAGGIMQSVIIKSYLLCITQLLMQAKNIPRSFTCRKKVNYNSFKIRVVKMCLRVRFAKSSLEPFVP